MYRWLQRTGAGHSCDIDFGVSIATPGFDAPPGYRNLDSVVTAIADRGVGFRDPQLMAAAPVFANVAIRNGVSCETDDELVYHKGWNLGASATAEDVELAVFGRGAF